MAQSILDKINTLISANLHSMVDSALQANSVKVMDEYVRQAEKNLENLEDATVTVGGTVKTLTVTSADLNGTTGSSGTTGREIGIAQIKFCTT